jgi:hypothetical protein
LVLLVLTSGCDVTIRAIGPYCPLTAAALKKLDSIPAVCLECPVSDAAWAGADSVPLFCAREDSAQAHP